MVHTLCLFQAFEPIAKIASEIIKKNKFDDNITVIGKRSTDLLTGKGRNKLVVLTNNNYVICNESDK